MLISKFVLKKYRNLNILILKFALKNLHIGNLNMILSVIFETLILKCFFIYLPKQIS